jgi:effector-binding domain-containing protein
MYLDSRIVTENSRFNSSYSLLFYITHRLKKILITFREDYLKFNDHSQQNFSTITNEIQLYFLL